MEKTYRKNKRDELMFVIYVFKAGDFIKVGIAENIVTRLSVFRTHCPLPVSIAYCSTRVVRPVAREIETACHDELAHCHVHGEWFKASPTAAIVVLDRYLSRAEKQPHPVQLKLVS